MDIALKAIIAVLVVFSVLYVMEPEGISGIGSNTQLIDMPKEGNGIMGRFIDGMAEMTWQPSYFMLLIFIALAGSLGLAIYWKKMED